MEQDWREEETRTQNEDQEGRRNGGNVVEGSGTVCLVNVCAFEKPNPELSGITPLSYISTETSHAEVFVSVVVMLLVRV